MPIDFSPGSFAAVAIAALFWWTVLSPVALLAIAALCPHDPRLRGALTLVVLVPPVVTLLPVAVMRGGLEAAAAGAGAAVLGVAVALTILGLVGREDPARVERYATAALLVGVAGGMIGSGALVAARLFG
jgi:hypothetical protein